MTMTETDRNVVGLQSHEAIEAEAGSWLIVLGREDVSEADRAGFQAWLAQSERHRSAFNALSSLWGDLALLKELDDIAESAVDLPAAKPLYGRRVFMAMAASLVLAVAGVTAFQIDRFGNFNQHEDFTTGIGQQRLIALSDGSDVQMNTDSRIEVDFSRDIRDVHLIRGEAHFAVAKNTGRPFRVYAAGGVVTAVGTAFTVRLRADDAVEVTVEEGRVALGSIYAKASAGHGPEPGKTLAPMAELTAGQNSIFGERVKYVAQMEQSELSRKLSWRQGVLAYAGDPLADVIADVSRYTEIEIEITDPALRELPIGGYFRVGEVEALLDSLELTFGLEVDRVDKNHVRLSAAS